MVNALFDEAAADPAVAVAERLKRGQSLPGFGHSLYPEGDPRGKLLIELVHDQVGDTPLMAMADSLVTLAGQSMNAAPNIDFGLVLLARALELPKEAPLLLFAAGRTAGWIGQIIEEYQREQLIRPRARYTGPRPNSGGV